MAWNEPGKGKDPWTGRGGDQGPPDLDEIVRKVQRRLGSILGGRGGKGSGTGGGLGVLGMGLLVLIAVALWLFSGFYKIDDAERGVVLRFGAYTDTTMPGLHWHLPWPIEFVHKVNVSSIEKFAHQTRMLTADENIVAVDLAVQYRHANPRDFLFNVRSPSDTLSMVSESAIREVVGKSNMDFVLGEGRADIAERTKVLIQTTLDSYGTGIEVTTVNLQDANFPGQVQDSVQDAIKAREDKERAALEAQSYANDILPRARGLAAREIQDANAYKARVIADASGEATRFIALLAEYEKAPKVTRDRLYLETVEAVYGSSTKVLMDTDGSGNLLYLPLDKLMERAGSGATGRETGRGSSTLGPVRPGAPDNDPRSREDLRSRGNR